jgi:DNA-binding LytR/AlgR family response regulator
MTEPAAYLVKLFHQKELFTSIEIALYNFSKKIEMAISPTNLVIKDSLFIKKEKHFIRLDFTDILFIKSDNIYLEIMMVDNKKHIVRGSLNDYINKLSNSFFRCHRSYIVNTNFLSSVNHNELIALNHTIPIGNTNPEELITMMNIG